MWNSELRIIIKQIVSFMYFYYNRIVATSFSNYNKLVSKEIEKESEQK